MEYILKGDLAFSKSKSELETIKNGFIHVKDGVILGTYKRLPASLKNKKLSMNVYSDLPDMHLYTAYYLNEEKGKYRTCPAKSSFNAYSG